MVLMLWAVSPSSTLHWKRVEDLSSTDLVFRLLYANLLALDRPYDQSVRTVVKTYFCYWQGVVVTEPWSGIYKETRATPLTDQLKDSQLDCEFEHFPVHFILTRRYPTNMAEFEHELFGCFESPSLCVIAFFAPCVVVGRTAEAMGEDCMKIALLTFFCGCPYWIIMRERIRAEKGYDEDMTMHLVKQTFCPCCVIVQNAREMGLGDQPAESAMSRQ